jgi:ubiquinone/menaquinone biosynthesis C-methylase UbiE
MTASERIALRVYASMTPTRMSARLTADRQRADVEFVSSICRRGDRVLDLACGYGRLTIPLAKDGCRMIGADLLSREMVTAARRNAQAARCRIKFVVASMLALPFAERSFDKVLCLGSSFIHLLTRAEQVCALTEVVRVLANGGVAVVEMNNGEQSALRRMLGKDGQGPDGRIIDAPIDGLTNRFYVHDRHSLAELAKACPSVSSRVVFRNIGGRRRLTLWLWKQ